MSLINSIKGTIGALTELAIMLLALAIAAQLLVGSGKAVVSISSIKKLNWYRSSMKIYNFLSRKYSKLLIKWN